MLRVFAFLFMSFLSIEALSCPYAKLIQRLEDHAKNYKAKELPRPIFSDDVLENPRAPKYIADAKTRAAILSEWNKHVLRLAEKKWKELGVQYSRVPYKNHDALVVLPGTETPLNRIAKVAESIANKTGYQLHLIFSPHTLLHETIDENGKPVLRLGRGSFRSGTNALHLPFKSVTELGLNATLRHELLHAHFDFLSEQNRTSLINGAFSPVDKGPLLWKGLNYREYMSLEELATFPINLEEAGDELRVLQKQAPSISRNKAIGNWLNSNWERALQTALNAKRAQNTLGHFERALNAGAKSITKRYKVYNQGLPDKRYTLVTLKWDNPWQPYEYQFKIPHSGKRMLSDFDVVEYLSKQHAIAKEVWRQQDALASKIRSLASKLKSNSVITDAELEELHSLLIAPRVYTLQFLKS